MPVKEKKNRKFMDYGDLEQLAYKLLYDENGEKTKKALETSELYDEIYIDEYQDCNSLQDAIFAAISKDNRFMVGDIKQSIYSFRGAEPYLFSNYRSAFEKAAGGRAVFLSNNFRCSENIIKFTNLVFSPVFSQNPDIPYTKDDELVFSKSSDTSECVTVSLIEKNEDETISETIAGLLSYEKGHEKLFTYLLRIKNCEVWGVEEEKRLILGNIYLMNHKINCDARGYGIPWKINALKRIIVGYKISDCMRKIITLIANEMGVQMAEAKPNLQDRNFIVEVKPI